MTLTPDNRREVEEMIAEKLDIMSAFRDLPDAAREEIARDIGGFLTNRQMALRKPENTYTPRITVSGNDINLDAAGTGKGHLGPTLPRWIDFVSATGYLDADGQMVHIQTAGGGADCMFDFLVSSCWATEVAAGRGTEGQVKTSLSGCTFKIYSTVKAAAAQCSIDFALGTDVTGTIAICGGTYLENNILVTTSQRWLGSGQQRTIIGSLAASLTTATVITSGNGAIVYLEELTIRASTGASSTAGGWECGTGTTLHAYHCEFRGGAATAARAAISRIAGTPTLVETTECFFPTFSGVSIGGASQTVHVFSCSFTGTGIAIEATDGLIIGGNTVINGSYTTGVRLSGSPDHVRVIGLTSIGSTTHIAFQSAGNSISQIYISDLYMSGGTTGIDFSTVTSASAIDNIVRGVIALDMTQAFLWSTSDRFFQLNIKDVYTDTATAVSTNTPPVGTTIENAYQGVVSKGTIRDNGLWGFVRVTAGGLKLEWGAFSVMFATTKVNVAAGNFTYGAGAVVYYVSVSSAGTLTANTTGAFPAGECPIAIVTVTNVGGNYIKTIENYDGFIRMPTASGGAAALASEAYLTVGNTTGLSAERAITPRYNLFATDGGANSTYTLDSWLEGAQITPAVTVLTLGTDGDAFHVAAGDFATIATPTRQVRALLVFDGVSVLTHGANLILQGAANFTSAAGDVLEFFWEGGTVWREINRHTAAAGVDTSDISAMATVSTTDATVTTLATIAIPTTTTMLIETRVTARRTGGTGGTAEDGASYVIRASLKNVAGTATLIGAVNADFTAEDQAGWDATIDVNAGNARVRVTGAVNNNVNWKCATRTLSVT